MGHVMAVKDRQQSTDNLFEPLKHTIELLKGYGQEMSDDVYQKLQVRISYCNCTYMYMYMYIVYNNTYNHVHDRYIHM